MTGWYDGIAPATALVRCDGGHHPLLWRRGRLTAPAHDVPAERALAALGGGRCPCLEVLAACRGGLTVEDLFLLWTEQAEPSVGTSQALERWARRVGRRSARPGSAADRRVDEQRTALLASLPVAFRRRLALGVFRAIAREPVADLSTSHPAFEPVFANLLAAAVRASALCDEGPSVELGVRWRPVTEGGEARLDRRGRTLFVTVSAAWVPDVWAWGIAAVEGWLVLEVLRRRSIDQLLVRAAIPGPSDRAELRYVSIRREGVAWRADPERPGRSHDRSTRASTTAFPW